MREAKRLAAAFRTAAVFLTAATFCAGQEAVPAWPTDRTGLLFLQTGDRRCPFLALKEDGTRLIPEYYETTAKGLTHFEKNWALRLAGGAQRVEQIGAYLTATVKKAKGMTVEMRIRPERAAAPTDGLIAWFGPESGAATNWAVMQAGSNIVFVAGSRAEAAKPVRIAVTDGTAPRQLIVTLGPGGLRAYADGRPSAEDKAAAAGMADWPDSLIVFGNNPRLSQPWHGVIDGAAVFCRTFTADEAARDAHAFRTALAARPPVKRLRLKATLEKKAWFPRPEATRYNQAHALFDWKVDQVLEGDYGANHIRVSHWIWLDKKRCAMNAAKPGLTKVLVVEPKDVHVQLIDEQAYKEGLPENDDLEEYYDTGEISFLAEK